ncbi:hypothetical protein, partial [Moorena sp. SIO3I6]|uniref:hypothetical protein n=1 Tax=Moorena sp. SIO3I6 TaxID=2607831 RepID=UPI0025FDF8C8
DLINSVNGSNLDARLFPCLPGDIFPVSLNFLIIINPKLRLTLNLLAKRVIEPWPKATLREHSLDKL